MLGLGGQAIFFEVESSLHTISFGIRSSMDNFGTMNGAFRGYLGVE